MMKEKKKQNLFFCSFVGNFTTFHNPFQTTTVAISVIDSSTFEAVRFSKVYPFTLIFAPRTPPPAITNKQLQGLSVNSESQTLSNNRLSIFL